MPFRILHTADLQLDVPIGGAGRTSPALTRQLAAAGLDTLDKLVDLALAERVDAVLVAGGLWTGTRADEVAGRRVADALDRLAQACVTTVIARHPGERLELLVDPRRLPVSVHVVDPAELEALELTGRDGTALVVATASGQLGLEALARRSAAAGGAAHVGMCPLPPRDPAFPDPTLVGTTPRYWALGGRRPARAAQLGPGGAWVVMPGPPQLHGPSDPGAGNGVVLADLDDSSPHPAPCWRRIAAVQLITVTAPLPPDPGLATLEALLDEQAAHYAASIDDRPIVLRAVLHGTGPGRCILADPAAEAGLLDGLRRLAERRDGAVWWAEVQLDLVPGPAAHRLVSCNARAEGLLHAATLARATEPEAVLGQRTDARARPFPGGPAWAALVTGATSLGFDLIVAGEGDDAAVVAVADDSDDQVVALERRRREVEHQLVEAALEDDAIPTEGQLTATGADEARLGDELEAFGARAPRSGGGELERLPDAQRRRHEAQVELDAATTTATMLRLGLERAVGDGPVWLRWAQPVALAVASAAVLAAVALLAGGVTSAGIAAALLALVSAAAALFIPALPLRESPDVTRMRLRLDRADADIRHWNEEIAALAGEAAATAAAAAAERIATLRSRRDGQRAGGAPLDEHGPATVSRRSLLVQEHRGLVEQLNRCHWTLDRLAVASWLLAQPAEAPPSVPPSDADPLGDGHDANAVGRAIRVLVTPAE